MGASVHVTEIRLASCTGVTCSAGTSVAGLNGAIAPEDQGSKSPLGFSSEILTPRGSGMSV